MSDSGGSVVVVVVGMGYVSAATVGTVALVAAASAVLLPLVAAAALIIGFVCYVRYFGRAVRTSNWRWAADILLAPAIAFGTVVVVPSLAQSIWMTALGTVQALTESKNLFFILLAALMGLALAYSVFATPVGAVVCMSEADKPVKRLASYGCFMWAALYWGLLAVVWSDGSSSDWLTTPL